MVGAVGGGSSNYFNQTNSGALNSPLAQQIMNTPTNFYGNNDPNRSPIDVNALIQGAGPNPTGMAAANVVNQTMSTVFGGGGDAQGGGNPAVTQALGQLPPGMRGEVGAWVESSNKRRAASQKSTGNAAVDAAAKNLPAGFIDVKALVDGSNRFKAEKEAAKQNQGGGKKKKGGLLGLGFLGL
ncbi:MAG TPA: hypothetical protein V6C52_01755 [Coleofasciculaceae cyanobacterium]|jgi:hypothetical protein